MVNVFKQLVKENEEKIEKYTNELKEAGFTDKDIRECRYIYNLKYGLMFEKSDNIASEDADIIYNNGYVKGLYEGAKRQLDRVINKLINEKIYKVVSNTEIDINDILVYTKILDTALSVKYVIIMGAYMYDENIAVTGEKEHHDYTEEYYIVARKDKSDKKYDYFKIDLDGLQQNYEPTEVELELFK